MGPSGAIRISVSNPVGEVTVVINFDPALPNWPLVNRGSPARCLVSTNTTGKPWPYYVKGPQGLLQGNVPTGNFDATVAQITAQSGITELSNYVFGLGAFVG